MTAKGLEQAVINGDPRASTDNAAAMAVVLRGIGWVLVKEGLVVFTGVLSAQIFILATKKS